MLIENWDGKQTLSEATPERPHCIAEVVRIVKQSGRRRIRAVGSRHSMTTCTLADDGVMIDMTAMNRILWVDRERLLVRVEAGALYLDIARELTRHDLQFHINTEIGNLTAGSAACCGTKDGAFSIDLEPEYGQVSSYVTAVKLVRADGAVVEIDEARDPDLMRVVRGSYGLLGIVVEVTFRVKKMQALSVRHRTYTLDQFLDELPTLRQQHQSLMLYILPFARTVMVELRSYRPDLRPTRRWPWWIRNLIWGTVSPVTAKLVTAVVPFRPLRYTILLSLGRAVQRLAPVLLRSDNTVPDAQTIRYAKRVNWRRYVFSFWAFRETDYPGVLREYCDFYASYYRETRYRPNLFTVGYRVNKDTSSILSYSADGAAITIDPVSTGGPEWDRFLDAYNDFASAHHGIPLLNQTPALTATQVRRAFGDQLKILNAACEAWDPEGRFFTSYFRTLLPERQVSRRSVGTGRRHR